VPKRAGRPGADAWESEPHVTVLRLDRLPPPELRRLVQVGDDPALTQTAGWVDAWTAQTSVYAVAAETASGGLVAP
jgi:hypothetical protein